MKMKPDLYPHCLEIAHALGLPNLDPGKFAGIVGIVEAEDYPLIAAEKLCMLAGLMSTPSRMEDVTSAILGEYKIPG